jgi:predicted DNA-binding transcriptional regulator AlpA
MQSTSDCGPTTRPGREVERYTKAADQQRLAAAAIEKVSAKNEQKLSNLADGLTIKAKSQAKSKQSARIKCAGVPPVMFPDLKLIPSESVSDVPAPRLLADYLNTEQLAAELGVATITVKRWAALKQGPPVTRIGRRIMYRRSSVQAWLVKQEQ